VLSSVCSTVGKVDPFIIYRLVPILTAIRGIANTFGAFQTYYETGLLAHESPSNISWIGSIQAFLLLVVGGLATGPIYDAGHLRGLVIFGTFAGVFGMMMTSLCREYWQVILAQGIVVGCGSGCLLLPGVAVMPQYFTKRRAFTTGVAAAGSSFGKLLQSETSGQ
jgi:MFS family permease